MVIALWIASHSLYRIAQYGGWNKKLEIPYQEKNRPYHKLRIYMFTVVTIFYSNIFISALASDWVYLPTFIPIVVLPIWYGIIYNHSLPVEKKELRQDKPIPKKKLKSTIE